MLGAGLVDEFALGEIHRLVAAFPALPQHVAEVQMPLRDVDIAAAEQPAFVDAAQIADDQRSGLGV